MLLTDYLVNLMIILFLFAFLFALIGLGIIAGAVFFAWQKKNFLKDATPSTGTIINVRLSGGVYYNTVRFQTEMGQTIEHTPSTATSWSNYQIGQSVPIYYNRFDPQQASIGSLSGVSPWMVYIFVAGIGLFFFAVGLGFLFLS